MTKRQAQHGYVGINYKVFDYDDTMDRIDQDKRVVRNHENRLKARKEGEIYRRLLKIIDEA